MARPRKSWILSAALLVAVLAAACSPGAKQPPEKAAPVKFPLEEKTIAELQEMMASGAATSESLVALYLKRIDEIDRNGPGLNAVLETNPDALAIARGLDRERREKGPRGPLHGIPVLIKDNIDTADKMETTAGSLALLGSKPVRDAFVAGRLRAAGAVILGKTNLSEWANFRSSRSVERLERPRRADPQPLRPRPQPVRFELGLGRGRVGQPGRCGRRHGNGRIDRLALVGLRHRRHQADGRARQPFRDRPDLPFPGHGRADGPHCRRRGDAAGRDDGDRPVATPRQRRAKPICSPTTGSSSSPAGSAGARIGVLRAKSFGFGPKLDPILQVAVEAMRKEGAEVIDPVEFPTLGKTGRSEYEVLLYEFKADLAAYLAARPGAAARSVADLIEFNRKNADREMPFFGQEILEEAVKKGPLTDKAYRDALAKGRDLMRAKGIDAVLAKHQLDALVVLTNGPAHMTDLVNGDRDTGGSSSLAAVAGYPEHHACRPAGSTACPWGSPSSAGPGASPRSSGWPTAWNGPSECGRRRACFRPRTSRRRVWFPRRRNELFVKNVREGVRMKTGRWIVCALFVLTLALPTWAWDAAASHDRASLDKFVAASVDRTASPPFSFNYGGKASPGFIGAWKVTSRTEQAADRTVRTVVYSDPATRLRITAVYTIYKDFPAAEWVLRLKNEGTADSPVIENLLACAADLPGFAGPVKLYRARGSSAERSDFGPIEDVLADRGEIVFGTSSGRSSDTTALPFFNMAGSGRGVLAAIGWSGSWTAAVRRASGHGLSLDAGMVKTRFKLLPGEDVRTPSVALLFWQGSDRMAGHNLFRRFILAHHTPRPGGKPLVLPLSHGVGFGGPFPCNEYVCATESYALAMIDRLKQFGIEPDACWIDAGWYENATKELVVGCRHLGGQQDQFPARPEARHGGRAKMRRERVRPLVRARARLRGDLARPRAPGVADQAPREPQPPAQPGQPEGPDVADRPHLELHPDRGHHDLPPGFQLRPGAVLEGHGRARPGRHRRDEAHRGALRLLGRASSQGTRACSSTTAPRAGGGSTSRRPAAASRSGGPTIRTSSPTGTSATPTAFTSTCRRAARATTTRSKYYFRSSMGGRRRHGLGAQRLVQRRPGARGRRRVPGPPALPFRRFLSAHANIRPRTRPGRRSSGTGPRSATGSSWPSGDSWRPRRRSPSSLSGLDPAGDYEVSYEDYGITVMKSGRELAAGLSIKIPEAPGSLLIKYRRLR